MELDLSGSTTVRKEITCGDCGHVYLIAQGQPSSRCQNCGNIEFFTLPGGPNGHQPQKLSSLSKEIAQKRVLPRLSPQADPLAPFRATADGIAVEEVRIRYQVEWQLWAMLVKNFQNPVFHAAYICQATAAGELERAAARYRDHRAVMSLAADSAWQAEVSELMLSRIESLSVMRMQAEAGGGWRAQLATRFYLLRADSGFMRLAFIIAGVSLMVKLFGMVWWR